MSQNDFNNDFKKRLVEYSSGIDHDTLWNDIFDKVPRRKKRRGLIWWFGGFGVVILLFGWIFTFSEVESIDKNLSQNETSIEAEKRVSGTEKKQLAVLNLESKTDIAKEPLVINGDIEKPQMHKTVSTRNTIYNQVQPFDNGYIKNNEGTIPSSLRAIESNTTKQSESAQFYINETNTSDSNNAGAKMGDPQFVRIGLLKLSNLPFLELPVFKISTKVISTMESKRPKRIKERKSDRKNMFSVDYALGSLNIRNSQKSQDLELLNDGMAHSSQAVRVQYGYLISPRFYAKAIVNLNVSTKKFTASVLRDTIVPTSMGEQLLATNIYTNGVIDTETGVPEVLAKFTRSVQKLNHTQSIGVGLGLGYIQKIGNLSFNIETSLIRSIYVDVNGFGIRDGAQRIEELSQVNGYYSKSPIFNGQLDLGIEIPLVSNISLSIGGQYQHGFSDRLISLTNSEYRNSLRGTIGIKRYW